MQRWHCDNLQSNLISSSPSLRCHGLWSRDLTEGVQAKDGHQGATEWALQGQGILPQASVHECEHVLP